MEAKGYTNTAYFRVGDAQETQHERTKRELESSQYTDKIYLQFLENAFSQYKSAACMELQRGNDNKAQMYEGYAQGISVAMRTFTDVKLNNF